MNLKKTFSQFVPKDRLYDDELRRFCWGTDASVYRMTPSLVIRSDNEKEVSDVLKCAQANRIPVTFRAAGTSLSGQGVCDSVLLVAGKRWTGYSFNRENNTITMQPGLVGGQVNRILSPYGRKFGPDPASIASCMVGGIVANNASGMSCGVHANSDRMIRSARIVLSDGSILDTGNEASRKAFAASHPEFIKELEAIRDEVRSDGKLSERIKYKYSIKNVTGLNLLPLANFDDPFDIITHLMVGSEGTLAFISEVTMDTLPVAPFNASAMLYFKDIRDAARSVTVMRNLPVCAAELLDKRSLASVNDTTGTNLTAILVQTEAQTEKELLENIKSIEEAMKSFDTVTGVRFSRDAEECAKYWSIRSGIFPMVGGMRKEGTSCLIEDIAFHIEDLPAATADLSDLLDRHGYDDSCIYGHALEGNFHFIINQSFDSGEDIKRYEALIRDVVSMVVGKYDGSLKAEHGTGRNMAPFVKYEWGEKAFSIMKRIKNLFDPEGILNPGVIFNEDTDCFLKNLKALPLLECPEDAPEETAEAFRHINKCIECGFCEVNCVSCGMTLSSRTRIAAQREIRRREIAGEDSSTLRRQYGYYGEKTCAGDGLCSTSCPMKINVADLTHEIRRQGAGKLTRKAWDFAAGHFHGTKNAIRGVLVTAGAARAVLGNKVMGALCRFLHKATGIPLWTPSTPRAFNAGKLKGDSAGTRPAVVYFPSCLNQMMGASGSCNSDRPLAVEMMELLHKAGYDVIFPENRDKLCCGTIWESKGMPDTAEKKVRELDEALWKASGEGKYPVLCDQSPCLHRMRKCITRMHLYEPAEFILKFLVPALDFHPVDVPVAVHQTCTMRLMGLGGDIVRLASMCSTSVMVPEGVGCCAFAGDKGMTQPELNAYALRELRPQVEKAGIKTGYSNSRTCEIGLETNSGIPYKSIVYLVNACTTPKKIKI